MSGEYEQFLSALSTRAEEGNKICKEILAKNWAPKLYPILVSKLLKEDRGAELLAKMLAEVEPRVMRWLSVSHNGRLPSVLMKVMQAYEKDILHTIDSLIAQEQVRLSTKAYIDTLPHDWESMQKRYLETVPQMINSPAKMEVVSGLANYLRNGNYDDKAFTVYECDTSQPEPKIAGGSGQFGVKKESRSMTLHETEQLLKELSTRHPGTMDYLLDSLKRTVPVYLKQPGGTESAKLSVNLLRDRVVGEEFSSKEVREKLLEVLLEEKPIRQSLTAVLEVWRQLRPE